MRLVRVNLADIILSGGLRPAPPSNQGKWFAESVPDAVKWGRRFYQQSGQPFHVIEIDVPQHLADQWYRDPFLDRIGPARYAEISDLPSITVVREVSVLPLGPP